MGTAVSCMWAAVTRRLLLNQGVTQLNKEVSQPHAAIVGCTGGANVGVVSPTRPPSEERHIPVDSLFTETAPESSLTHA